MDYVVTQPLFGDVMERPLPHKVSHSVVEHYHWKFLSEWPEIHKSISFSNNSI